MALIKCSECGKEISDKASVCPNCGCPASEQNKPVVDELPVINNTEIQPEKSENNSKKEPEETDIKKTNKKLFIVFGCLIALVIFIVIIALSLQKPYIDRLSQVMFDLDKCANDLETLEQWEYGVWHNAVYKKENASTDQYTHDDSGKFYEDFNDALDELYADPNYIAQKKSIEEQYNTIQSELEELKNPSDDYYIAYNAAVETSDSFYKMMDIVLYRANSLNSLRTDYNSAKKEYEENYTFLEYCIAQKLE